DLVASMAAECVAHGALMLSEHAPVLVRSEAVEQPSRALDVREDQRDRPRRLPSRRHAAMIARPLPQTKPAVTSKSPPCQVVCSSAWRSVVAACHRGPDGGLIETACVIRSNDRRARAAASRTAPADADSKR